MSAHDLLFWIFGLATVGGALGVVLSQNVARMAFWLIISLGSTAGLFFLLQADFVGAAQLLVYVGGTLVLLIFGIMLTASGPLGNLKTNPGEAVLGGVLGLCLLGLICFSACNVAWETLPANSAAVAMAQTKTAQNLPEEGNSARALGFSFLGLRPDRDLGRATGASSQGYLLPFEIVSVHLLVVLVGAAYLARAKRKAGPPTVPVRTA